MTCPDCVRNASRVLALEEELRAYRLIVDGSVDEQIVRLVSVALDLPPRSARLVAMLFAANGRSVAAGVLMDALWPQAGGDRPGTSLRSCVYHARQVLGDEAVVRGEGGYRLSEATSALVARILPIGLLPRSGLPATPDCAHT